jgi:hypothetical protein
VIVFGSSHRIKAKAVAAVFTMARERAGGEPGPAEAALAVLTQFRADVYWSSTRRADALFELGDAVLCAPGPVTDLARLSLATEFRRGHGALYDALNCGHTGFARLRRALAQLPLPDWGDGQIRLAVDVSAWLRPGAGTSPGRLFCRVPGRGKNAGTSVPGWPYSFVAALSPGPSSWVLPLDAVRLTPGSDDLEGTAAQLRDVITRLIAAGQWEEGDPPVLVALDAGYNVTRLAYLLADLPLVLVGRVRSGRVFYRDPPPRPRGPGQAPRHGEAVNCARDRPDLSAQGRTRHGPVTVTAWKRVHQKLHRGCGGWASWPQRRFPVVRGTHIRLAPAPGGPPPMLLWASVPDPGPDEVRALWQCYLRRFDLEHAFRFIKQQLGWTRPHLRDPNAADRWTWIILTSYAQLYLARALAADVRLPWQPRRDRPGKPQVLTPGRVRAGFRHARAALGTPASVAKPAGPGPGRPPGSKNRHKAPRPPVGKTSPKKQRPATRPRKRTKPTG